MRTTKKILRENIRKILREIFFTSILPNDGDEDREETSLLKRIGGRHTATLDWGEGFSESDADELDIKVVAEEDEEEESS